MLEHSPHESSGRVLIVESDVVGDAVQIVQRRGPDYFSHLAMRILARAWDSTRP